MNKLNTELRSVLNQKDVQERMIAAGFDLADTTLEQFDAFIRKDVALYTRIIKESKMRLD